MRIAVELISLSEDTLTGIGKVGLQHCIRLVSGDGANEYYAYSIKKFVQLDESMVPGARLAEVISPVGRVKNRVEEALANSRERLGGRPGSRIVASANFVLLRILKIILEAADTACIHLMLARSLKKNRIDLYLGTHADFFPAFFPRGVKKAWLIHDIVWKLHPGTMKDRSALRNFFIARNIKRCDLLFAVSDATRRDLRDVLGIRSRIVTVHNAADGRVFYPAKPSAIRRVSARYRIEGPYLLSVCTLEPRKNIETLLRAFARMKGREKVRLVLVGKQGWIHPEFFALIDELGIRDEIILPGYVPEEELAPLYSGAQLFAFPSLYEGYGMPVLEAMQCGCPVVASNSSSIPEVLGDAGVMVDPMDIDALAEAMARVLSNRRIQEQMRRRGLVRAELFSWGRSSAILCETIKSILGKERRSLSSD